MKTKIYIECTNTYGTEILTGIQRVVRNIVRESEKIAQHSAQFEVVPVIIVNDDFVAVGQLPDHSYQKEKQDTPVPLRQRLVRRIRDIVQSAMQSRTKVAILRVVRNYFPRFFGWLKANYIKFKLAFLDEKDLSVVPNVEFQRGDILLMLDSSWHMPIWQAIHRAKSASAYVVFVAYDLIPISHPKFCDDYLVKVFSDFYQQAIRQANGFIAISASVRDDVKNYVEEVLPGAAERLDFDFFHLGADFIPKRSELSIRHELIALYESNKQHYLMVSTIEPRKNHQYLIDAFDCLWQQGVDVTLTIVGRVGWKVSGLMGRLQSHPELGHRLFLLHDLNDRELSYCYEHSTALVFPSYVEGFGLPIIEALQHRLPVIASDIPVHREVGQQQVMYVDLNDVNALVNKVIDIYHNQIPAEYVVANDFRWLTWKEATEQLLSKILEMKRQHESK